MAKKQTVHPHLPPKVVILGASGRLGRLIRPSWGNMNTVWQSRTAQDGFKSIDILEDPDDLVALLDGADAVVCLAGVTPASKNGTIHQNAQIASACLDAARLAGVGRVFLTSTAAVYGRETGKLTEQHPVKPMSDYGHAKVEMEHIASQHEQESTVLRIGNVAGADAILGNWHAEMKIEQLEDGTTPRRSYVGPETLGRIITELTMFDKLPSILNIATPRSIYMNELLDCAGLLYAKIPATSQTIPDVTLDTKLLEQFVAFTHEHSLPSFMVAEWKRAVSAK
jgi:nucleoside-diphosphate-sugar epimerase